LFGLIEKLGQQRLQLCDAASVSLPNVHSGRIPVMAGVSQAIVARWLALLELIASCRVANEINGYIINARRGQVAQLLQILRGGVPVTYGPQGRTNATMLRELARA
jgi:flagellar biosynthesis/type III secretory pathway chaperone